MQFDQLTGDLADREFVVFDKEALVVYQSPSAQLERMVIDLADLVANVLKLEMFTPTESLLNLDGRLVLLRQAGDFFIALLSGENGEGNENLALDMLKLHSRLLSELT
jgi:hypothetical protein